MPVTITSIVVLLVLFVALPAQSSRTHRSGLLLQLPRTSIYVSVVASQWLVVLILSAALWIDRWEVRRLGLDVAPRLAGAFDWPDVGILLTWGAFLVAAAAAIYAIFWLTNRALGRGESDVVHRLIPRTDEEKAMFALAVAPTAGFVEELLYRGVAITCLTPLVGSTWLAAVLSSVGFALGHVYQGALGATRAGALGMALALPFVVTGSLVPSMIVHALIDIVAGLFLHRWLLGEPDGSSST